MTLPNDILIRIAGEDQAILRAGPWPRNGTIAMCEAAAERAIREARRTQDIEYRWNARASVSGNRHSATIGSWRNTPHA